VGWRRIFPHLTPTLSAPRGGEGDLQLPADRLQYTLNVFHDIPIPEPDHAITSPGDFLAAYLVCAGSKRMLSAIELNDELRCRTGEIDHVPPNRMLTTKSIREA
jgi:hypothetical protein